jgi:thiamine biosynthesis lipoprotein
METVTLATYAMGTRFELLLLGENALRLRAAGEEALREIERLHNQLSIFEPTSDISRINRYAAHHAIQVEPRLFSLLKRCELITELTDGAFDITIGSLMHKWGFHNTDSEQSPLNNSELEATLEVTGMKHVMLLTEGQNTEGQHSFAVRFDRPGIRLDLGAIGKGYAIERAVNILRDLGIKNALIHGGTSTAYGIGSQPDGMPWKIGVRIPVDKRSLERTIPELQENLSDQKNYLVNLEIDCLSSTPTPLLILELKDSALSVSTTQGRCFCYEGKTFSHEIDPRTGQPLQQPSTAIVMGPSPTECDALSTALIILGKEGINLIRERFSNYWAYLAT